MLGAHEVGMLRALAERGVHPDIVLGTSVGAINGAFFAADPTLAGVERLSELWRESNWSERSRGAALRRLTTLARSGTHLESLSEMRERLVALLPGRAHRGAPGALPVRGGLDRASGRALVRPRPPGGRRPGLVRGAGHPPACADRRRALHRRRDRQLDSRESGGGAHRPRARRLPASSGATCRSDAPFTRGCGSCPRARCPPATTSGSAGSTTGGSASTTGSTESIRARPSPRATEPAIATRAGWSGRGGLLGPVDPSGHDGGGPLGGDPDPLVERLWSERL